MWLPLARSLPGNWPTTQACALDWESNQWLLGSQACAQSTELHQLQLRSSFTGNMIMYVRNPKKFTKWLLDLISKFSKVAKPYCKNQSYFCILTINNQKLEFKTNSSIRNMTYLGIDLPGDLKYLCTENYRTLLRKIKENPDKWRDILCSWIKRLNIVNMLILPKLIHSFNMISIPAHFF